MWGSVLPSGSLWPVPLPRPPLTGGLGQPSAPTLFLEGWPPWPAPGVGTGHTLGLVLRRSQALPTSGPQSGLRDAHCPPTAEPQAASRGSGGGAGRAKGKAPLSKVAASALGKRLGTQWDCHRAPCMARGSGRPEGVSRQRVRQPWTSELSLARTTWSAAGLTL